jgi:acyl carrier protein
MITVDEIFGIIRESNIDTDVNTLESSSTLEEQGLDSLDRITILFALEERYKIKIPEEDVEQGKLASINAIVEYVSNKKP